MYLLLNENTCQYLWHVAETVPMNQFMAVHTCIREAMYQSNDFHFQLKKQRGKMQAKLNESIEIIKNNSRNQ